MVYINTAVKQNQALDDAGFVLMKDGGYRECWYPEKEIRCVRQIYNSENSDGMDSLEARALCPNSEGIVIPMFTIQASTLFIHTTYL